jgi:ribosome-binding protein aMBF1 (putative translation factor)
METPRRMFEQETGDKQHHNTPIPIYEHNVVDIVEETAEEKQWSNQKLLHKMKKAECTFVSATRARVKREISNMAFLR